VKPVPGPGSLPLAIVLALALALAVAGCGADPAGPSTDGPLGPPNNVITQCAPTPRAGHPVTIGLLGETDTGSKPLVIDRVTLARPKRGPGLQLAGWGIIAGSGELGVYEYWPVRGKGLKLVRNYRMNPRQSADIVVGVTAYGRGGYTPGALVYYHSNDKRYLYKSTISMRVVVAGKARCAG
jgi:hypothetical protein